MRDVFSIAEIRNRVKKSCQTLRRESGNALVVVLVAAGVGATISILIADMSVTFSKLKASERVKTDVKLLRREIEDLISQKNVCLSSFVNLRAVGICQPPLAPIYIVRNPGAVPILSGADNDQFRSLTRITYEFTECDPIILAGSTQQSATLVVTAHPPYQIDSTTGAFINTAFGGSITSRFRIGFQIAYPAGVADLVSCQGHSDNFSPENFCEALKGFRWDENRQECVPSPNNCAVSCALADVGGIGPTGFTDVPDGVVNDTDLSMIYYAIKRSPFNFGRGDIDCDGKVTYVDWFHAYNCMNSGITDPTLNMQSCVAMDAQPSGGRDLDCNLDGIGNFATASDLIFTDTVGRRTLYPSIPELPGRAPTVLADLLKGDVNCDGRITAEDHNHIRYCRNKYGALAQERFTPQLYKPYTSPIAGAPPPPPTLTRTSSDVNAGNAISSTGDPTSGVRAAMPNDMPFGDYCFLMYQTIGDSVNVPDFNCAFGAAGRACRAIRLAANSSCPSGFRAQEIGWQRNLIGIITLPGITVVPPFILPHVHTQSPPYHCQIIDKEGELPNGNKQRGFNCMNAITGEGVGLFVGADHIRFRMCCLDSDRRRLKNPDGRPLN